MHAEDGNKVVLLRSAAWASRGQPKTWHSGIGRGAFPRPRHRARITGVSPPSAVMDGRAVDQRRPSVVAARPGSVYRLRPLAVFFAPLREGFVDLFFAPLLALAPFFGRFAAPARFAGADRLAVLAARAFFAGALAAGAFGFGLRRRTGAGAAAAALDAVAGSWPPVSPDAVSIDAPADSSGGSCRSLSDGLMNAGPPVTARRLCISLAAAATPLS